MTDEEKKPPFHVINIYSGKHCGPFSTELDAALARSMGASGWTNGQILDRKAFDQHLKRQHG